MSNAIKVGGLAFIGGLLLGAVGMGWRLRPNPQAVVSADSLQRAVDSTTIIVALRDSLTRERSKQRGVLIVTRDTGRVVTNTIVQTLWAAVPDTLKPLIDSLARQLVVDSQRTAAIEASYRADSAAADSTIRERTGQLAEAMSQLHVAVNKRGPVIAVSAGPVAAVVYDVSSRRFAVGPGFGFTVRISLRRIFGGV